MPIYEYRCEACGQALEVMQKLGDAALKDCPSCSRPALKKLISAAGFQLKGSGWYATDFKGGAKKPSEAPSSNSDSDTKKTHSCGGGPGGCTH
ncbi:MAG: zinc ribbon domain-containing protein [Gammaproteobacteria bacterium]|nr:zinc ribbon domain-containing protein [Gammaproteobacteria bacterium]